MADALDALRCGVVLTNAEGTILHANHAAERMLRDGGVLQETRGVLRAMAPGAARELRDAIGLAALDAAKIGKSGLAIRLSEAEAAPVFAHVLAFDRGRLPDAAAAGRRRGGIHRGHAGRGGLGADGGRGLRADAGGARASCSRACSPGGGLLKSRRWRSVSP